MEHEPCQKTYLRNDPETHKMILRGKETKKKIAELIKLDLTDAEIANYLKLNDKYVYKIKKQILAADLTNPDVVLRANNALLNNLAKDDMGAVKLVYSAVDKELARDDPHYARQGSTTININFDGLRNSGALDIINKKVDVHGQKGMEGVIDITLGGEDEDSLDLLD